MLLDVSCTVKEFNEFLQKGMDAGIEYDFAMEGRDKYSGFGTAPVTPEPSFEVFTESSEDETEELELDENNDDI